VIDAYEEHLKEASRNTMAETYEQVTQAKDALEKELQKQEKARLERRSKGPLIWGEKDSGTFHLAQLTALNAKRTAVPLQKMDNEDRLKAIEVTRKKGSVTERLLSPLGGNRDKPTIMERSLEEQLLRLFRG
jgi:hypothetical protein